MRSARPRASEQGSALLIVFVFAAIIAIMLYRELPVAAFEARRNKEQLLMDRGHEYQRAVQLYYRKFRGQYPASFDQLENTNNTRFLRRRYKDPFTGKDDWRLLHSGGPNGALTDSKVNPINQNGANQNGSNQNGQQSQPAANGFANFSNSNTASFGTSASSTQNATTSAANSFPGAIAGGFASTSDGSAVEVPAVPKRAAAIASTAGAVPGQTPTSSELAQDPSVPLLPTSDSSTPTQGANGQPANGNANPANGAAVANGAAPMPGQQPGTNAMQSVQNLFNNGPSLPAGQNAAGAFGQPAAVSNTGSSGQLHSGGLAGVASRAEGPTIKKVNEQTNYSLWEFWYDPTKDTSMGQNGSLQNGAGGQNVQNGTTLGQPASSTGFGSASSTATGDSSNNTGQQSTPTPNATAPNSPGSANSPQ